jgi:hypothetical protein
MDAFQKIMKEQGYLFAFESWWIKEGQCITKYPEESQELYIKHVAAMSWINAVKEVVKHEKI